MRDLMYVITLVTDPKPSSMSFGGLCWGIGLSMVGYGFVEKGWQDTATEAVGW